MSSYVLVSLAFVAVQATTNVPPEVRHVGTFSDGPSCQAAAQNIASLVSTGPQQDYPSRMILTQPLLILKCEPTVAGDPDVAQINVFQP